MSKFKKKIIFNEGGTCDTEFIIRVWKSIINYLRSTDKLQIKRKSHGIQKAIRRKQ